MKNIEELLEDLAAFQVLKAAEHVVYWQEWDRKEKPVLAAAPLHIAPLMRKHVFDEIPTVICASATLQVGGGFSHFTREVGADGAKELDVGSPFDFERQCELRIYPGAPDPREPQFLDPFSTCVMGDLVEESKGGAFLLFTSHKALKKAHALLSGYFDRLGLKTFVQGNYPPKHIVEQFRRHDNCVLFGTDTFWQGVDVRGENLRLVVLHKLPFAVPTHPLRLAREDAIKKRGGNPFVTLSVPEAVIKVKQGFGRLIRSSDDTGVVAILDPRLKTKGYGKTFLKSLPPCSVKEIS